MKLKDYLVEATEKLGIPDFFAAQRAAIEGIHNDARDRVRACVYFPTGKGKTFTSLAALASRGETEVLVIAPPATQPDWVEDGAKLGVTVHPMSHAKFRLKTTKLSRRTAIICDEFQPDDKTVHTHHQVFSGVPAQEVADYVDTFKADSVYVEDYDPRSHFNNDVKMVQSVGALRLVLPDAVLVDNAGVTTIVKPALLRYLQAWSFSTPTHHQDLRSAARIAVYGMLKNKSGQRELLTLAVKDHLKGAGWNVVAH